MVFDFLNIILKFVFFFQQSLVDSHTINNNKKYNKKMYTLSVLKFFAFIIGFISQLQFSYPYEGQWLVAKNETIIPHLVFVLGEQQSYSNATEQCSELNNGSANAVEFKIMLLTSDHGKYEI